MRLLLLIMVVYLIVSIVEAYSEDLSILKRQKDEITFKVHIQPIFHKHCSRCHKSRFLSQCGLRLNSVKSILKGGDSGPVVVPGAPNNSLLIKQISADKGDERRMPPKGNESLGSDEILLIKKWIQQGVK